MKSRGLAFDMKKGKVSRLNSTPIPQEKVDLDKEMPPRWHRSQDHFERMTELIRIELDDEVALVEERWKTWTKQRLLSSGYALFDLTCRTNGRFFGDDILVFEHPKRSPLPDHRFTNGDIVLISRTRPWDEKIVEGVVLDQHRSRLRVVVPERPKDLKKGYWRLDRGANRVAHDRMHQALISFHSSEREISTPLRDLILGTVHDMKGSAELPPEIHGKNKHNLTNDWKAGLNESQQRAFESAIHRRLTLIQGPPGTGKTFTAVRILSHLAQTSGQPVLATAESNVAVDNLLEGLLDMGINALRIGRPVKVRDHLRDATLDAHVDAHHRQEELNDLRDDFRQINRELPSLKGKEKGLAHRDSRSLLQQIRRIEREVIDDVLSKAEVVCATTVGCGHNIIADRRFPIVLIDEATQATEPSSIVPISKGSRQLILVGDQQQLPPTVISKRAEDGGLNHSLFQRMLACGLETEMLTTQYRMHPSIREFPSARFYENRLLDGCSRDERPCPAGFLWPNWDKPIAFVPVLGVEETEEEGKSRRNRDEAALVYSIVSNLVEPGDIHPSEIGVISPYNGQVRLLQELFDEHLLREQGGRFEGLEIKSVDGYQGREKEVIVFSCVRANEQGEVGFLSDFRRLNVAITRAKRGLILLGHPHTLRHDHNWKSYLEWMEESELFAWHITS